METTENRIQNEGENWKTAVLPKVSTLNARTKQSDVYKAMRNIKGRPPRTINILNEDGQLYRRNDEIANRLGQSFKQVSNTTN